MWFFPREDIPSDISAGAPLPDTWGKPMAFYPASHCDPFKFFNSHNAIFDTTLWYVLVYRHIPCPRGPCRSGTDVDCIAVTGRETPGPATIHPGRSRAARRARALRRARSSSAITEGRSPKHVSGLVSLDIGTAVLTQCADWEVNYVKIFQ